MPAYFSRALMLTSVGRYDAARADLDAILKADPANASAIVKKADIATRQNRDDEVVQILTAGITRLPNDPKLRLALAGFYLRRKQL